MSYYWSQGGPSRQWLQFCMEKTQNKTLCFVVIADGFSKINLHMEAKQVTRVFSFTG